MYPKTHILLGFLFVALLKIFSQLDYISLIIIFLASFLIDIDHWLIYAIKKKSPSIKRAYKWFLALEKLKKKPEFLCVFHTIEFLVAIILLGLKYQIFMFILIGVIFHLFLDLVDGIIKKEYRKDISIVFSLIKNARKSKDSNKTAEK